MSYINQKQRPSYQTALNLCLTQIENFGKKCTRKSGALTEQRDSEMYFNFFHLLAILLFYYSTFFFSFTKFLLKSFPGFLMISPYYQLLMIFSQLAYLYYSQLIKGQIRKMLSSKSKYQCQKKKKGVSKQLFPGNLLFSLLFCPVQNTIHVCTNGILSAIQKLSISSSLLPSWQLRAKTQC